MGFLSPFAHGNYRVAALIFEENYFIDQDSNGFLPNTQKWRRLSTPKWVVVV